MNSRREAEPFAVTVAEAAKITGRDRSTIYAWLREPGAVWSYSPTDGITRMISTEWLHQRAAKRHTRRPRFNRYLT